MLTNLKHTNPRVGSEIFFKHGEIFNNVFFGYRTGNVFWHRIQVVFLDDFMVSNCAVRLIFSHEPVKGHLKKLIVNLLICYRRLLL